MKKQLCLWLCVLLCVCPLVTVLGEAEPQLRMEANSVTGRYESYPVADWIPDYCEVYTVDMEMPADFPSFTIAQVRPFYPKSNATKQALQPVLPKDGAFQVKIRVNDQGNHCQLSSSLNGLWSSGQFRNLGRHSYEDHAKQAEIERAVSLVKDILDTMKVSYEFPFFTVLRSEDWTEAAHAQYDPQYLERMAQSSPRFFLAHLIDSPDYGLLFPGYTIIRARFEYGGLPCGENEFSKDLGSPSGGSYAGGGGVIEFVIDDDGYMLKGHMNFAQEVIGEEAFEGRLLTWEEALSAFIEGNEAIMRNIGKGWWLEYGSQSAENPNAYHIVEMSPGCTFQGGRTKPVWLIRCAEGSFESVWMVDAQTGSIYR